MLQLTKSSLPEGEMVLLGGSSLCFKGSQCLHIQSEASPWSWMHCDALRHSELLTQWQGITSQEALIFVMIFHWKFWSLTHESSDINASRVLTCLQGSLQPSKGSGVKVKLRTEGLVSFWTVSFLTYSEECNRWKISSVDEVIIAGGNKKMWRKSASVLLVHKGSYTAFHWSVPKDFYMGSPRVTAMTWPRTVILNGISCVPMFKHILGTFL
jgi:hypothetical protein